MLISRQLAAPHGFSSREDWAEAAAGAFTAHQVHGALVADADSLGEGEGLEADGLLTSVPGRRVAVRTADCVPILLHAPDVGAVAAVHAGWRGTIAGIARVAVERLTALRGAAPAQIQAAIGPSIGRCCYEVDEALARRFEERFGPMVVVQGEGRPRLDLAAANRLALLEARVDPARIELLGLCTQCESNRFFSYRREGGSAGRQYSYIAPRSRD